MFSDLSTLETGSILSRQRHPCHRKRQLDWFVGLGTKHRAFPVECLRLTTMEWYNDTGPVVICMKTGGRIH